MKTKAAAFQSWLEGFSLPVYSAQSVPTDAKLPYITYTFSTGMFYEEPQNIVVNVWYGNNATEADANAKAEEIGRALGLGGVRVSCTGGAMWLMRGEPFSQTITTDSDIHRRYINITVEFLTVE